MVLLEIVGRERLGPRPKARDREHAILHGGVDDDRGYTGKIHIFGLHHPQRDAGGHARIDRVSSRFQNAEPGLGGEILAGRHHVARAHDRRSMRLHVILRETGSVRRAP